MNETKIIPIIVFLLMWVIAMDIYIKPVKKFSLNADNIVRICDICEVYAPPNISKKLKNLKILEIKSDIDKNYIVSVIDIINIIDQAFTGCTVNNVGEADTVIEYNSKPKENKSLKQFFKIFVVVVILVAGSSTAIMSFHSDAQMAQVFENYYYIFFNEKIQNPLILDIPYSIGLAVGIIVFFNHFSGKKLTSDPTPIEVEMSLYEDNVLDTVIDNLNNEKNSNS